MAPPRRESDTPADPTAARSSYDSWENLYEDNVGWVYRLLYAHVGNRVDAEDLTSEVFLAALRPLRISASRGEVRAYMKVTARTVLAQHWRRHFRVEITRLGDDPNLPDLDEPVDAPDPRVARWSRAILDGLSERHRTILELRFLQGMPVKDAAQTMGISLGNAKVLQHRALTAVARAGVGATGATA